MIRLLAGAFLAMALASCDSPKSLLQDDDLQRAARDTASLAMESSLLVEQIRQGSVEPNYVWVHQQALQEESRKAGEPLHKLAPAALRERQQQVIAVSDGLSAALEQAPLATADAGELDRLTQVFSKIGARAKALKGGK